MTTKEDVICCCDPHHARLLAVHLVEHVLDEAYVIANVALESGQPWRYRKLLRDFGNRSQFVVNTEDESIISQDDSDAIENKNEHIAEVVATSTPFKIQGELKTRSECNFIGQGDEDMGLCENELTKSTSMFIKHLFDMSDVEQVIICNDSEILQDNLNVTKPSELFTHAMLKIMNTCVNSALGMDFGVEMQASTAAASDKSSKNSEGSEFSFLADACVTEIGITNSSCIDTDRIFEQQLDSPHMTVSAEVQEITDTIEQKKKENYVELYENTYLTLNRDYEQGSEDDGEPLLQDPQDLNLHEIELMTVKTSHENLCVRDSEKEKKDLAATSMISPAASGSRKTKLARRCRIQGAKLLSCFKGWWRRQPPIKNKEIRFLNSNEGMCPLSPNARRRATSLLDNRIHRTPSPSGPVVWKFNTVTEALVNSSRWKDYTFETKPQKCDECSFLSVV